MRADDVYAILKGKIVKLTEDIKEVGDWKPIRHQGTVQTAEDLPADAKEGHMYNVATDSVYGAAGMNVVKTADGWDPMGPIVNMDLYLSKEEAKKGYQPAGDYLTENKAKETYQPAGNYSTREETEKKLNKNQGIDNAGKITGINADGDIVPMFPTGVQYNEETNLLEFGTDPNMLNKGIQLDATLKKSGYAADSAIVGENIDSLKEDISNKITKFYASSQGETHLADSDNGKIMDMMVYGKSEQKQYSGKNLLNATLQTTTVNGVTCTNNGDGTYTLDGTANANAVFNLGSVTFTGDTKYKICGCPQGGGIIERYHIEPYGSTNEQRDIGNGVIYSLSNDETKAIYIVVTIGFRASNLLFKPMITTDLTVTYDDFEPYTGGIPSPSPDYPQEIKSVVNPTVKVCGKNLLKATLESTTKKGITCTNNGDGTYTLNGTANGGSDTTVSFNVGYTLAKSGRYIVTGCPNGGSNEKYNLRIGKDNIPWGTYVNSDLGNGCLINVTDNTPITLNLMIKDGYTCNNVIFKPMIVDASLYPDTTYDDFEPYQEQTVTLPYTLNAIPVSSGGNVTIDGQQYVSDYVDVERGKLVRMCKEIEKVTSDLLKALSFSSSNESVKYAICNGTLEIKEANNSANVCYALCSHFKPIGWYSGDSGTIGVNIVNGEMRFYFGKNSLIATLESAKQFFEDNEVYISGVLKVPKEIDLTHEEIAAFKALATYYPITNISINSEQLDGYTVFNYPISMENGWNYVKQQIGDTRDYIYDMDLQSAEAYVNSEYAIALTELEV